MNSEFIKSVYSIKECPISFLTEIAFIGRSNVGKSSMINTLISRKNLVRTSKEPGKTRTINFYNIEEKYMFVDLPGYGYAKISKKEREVWYNLIRSYLTKRKQLRCVFFIFDIRKHIRREK